jgi:hypothetical protein
MSTADISTNRVGYRERLSRAREREIEPFFSALAVTERPIERGLSVEDEAMEFVRSAQARQRTRFEILRQLAEYRVLQDDWDGDGALSPSHHAVDLAEQFLNDAYAAATMPIRAYVTKEGGVGLVWERASGYADLDIDEDGMVAYYARSADGHSEHYSTARTSVSRLPPAIWAVLQTL